MSDKVKSRRRKIIETVLGIAVSAGCLWWVLRSVNMTEFLEEVRQADWIFVLAAVFTTLYSYLFRSWRWPYFFAKQGPKFLDSFRCLMVGFFMNNILPARMGEFVRAYLGAKATKLSGTLVLATVFAERVADGLALSLLFVAFFSTSTSPDAAGKVYWVVYFFLFAAIATVAVLLVRERIFSFLERLGDIMPGHLSAYTLRRIRRFIEGLEPLLHPKRFITLAVFSIGIWLTELLVYYEVSIAFGQRLDLATLALFLAVVNFSSLIPAAPGGVGVIEAFATGALVYMGVDREKALAMVATQHVVQYVVVGVPGAFFMAFNLGGRIIETAVEAEEAEENGAAPPKFSDVSQAKPEPLRDAAAGEPQPVPSSDEIAISVVIPAYNEEARLPKTLLSTLEYIKKRPDEFEVLVVDDGSKDGTSEVVRQFSSISPNIKLLTYPVNRGKGYAVRFGFINAIGRLIVYADADGATPIEEIERLEEAIARGAHIAIGSRAMYSNDTAVATVWYRKYIGRVFNGLVNMLILPGIADTQCGFKMFLRPVGRYIFSRTQADRFSFDVEVLFLARKAGLKIVEVPINWTNIPGSKVNLAKDSIAMFLDILKFRFHDMLGKYGSTSYQEFAREYSEKQAA